MPVCNQERTQRLRWPRDFSVSIREGLGIDAGAQRGPTFIGNSDKQTDYFTR